MNYGRKSRRSLRGVARGKMPRALFIQLRCCWRTLDNQYGVALIVKFNPITVGGCFRSIIVALLLLVNRIRPCFLIPRIEAVLPTKR